MPGHSCDRAVACPRMILYGLRFVCGTPNRTRLSDRDQGVALRPRRLPEWFVALTCLSSLFLRCLIAYFLVGGALLPASAAEPTVKSILDLQSGQKTTRVQSAGREMALTDLNPAIGQWFLLDIAMDGRTQRLHLAVPDSVHLALDPVDGVVAERDGRRRPCPLEGNDGLLAASARPTPYAPTCGGLVAVRRTVKGDRSMMEAATDLLRTTGGAGEYLINFYKNNFNDTAEQAKYGTVPSTGSAGPDAPVQDNESTPPNAEVGREWLNRTPGPSSTFDLPIDGADAATMRLGAWYRLHGEEGIFGSVITPEAAGSTDPGRANNAYLVAYDLDRYALRYVLGATHPALNWSDRAPPPHVGPGPDGFEDAAPLARTGMIPPWDREQIVGSFTGGFKREHGAFKAGPNVGKHYGFAESGVIFSRLQPGLMTFFAGADGKPDLRTWRDEDRSEAGRLLFARQTGYALLENGTFGAHLMDPNGNWSGSNDGHLLTMRAGVCLLAQGGRTWLVYGLFSATTPHGMAQTFKAYGCGSATLLDMNSPLLTYAAVYHHEKGQISSDKLSKGMRSASQVGRERFIDVPDSRDFFYLVKR